MNRLFTTRHSLRSAVGTRNHPLKRRVPDYGRRHAAMAVCQSGPVPLQRLLSRHSICSSNISSSSCSCCCCFATNQCRTSQLRPTYRRSLSHHTGRISLVRRWFSAASMSPTSITDDDTDDSTDEEIEISPKDDKKARKLRRVACQSIPAWMNKNSDYFEHTVKALNLNFSTSSSRWRNGAMKYREMYTDSIPSFMEWLQTADSLPPHIEQALDRLVDAGFSDISFAKEFRSDFKNQIQHAETTVELQERIRSYEKRQAVMDDIYASIQELQTKKDALMNKVKAYENEQVSVSKRKADVSPFVSLFTLAHESAEMDPEQRKAENDYKNAKRDLIRLERQLDGRQEHLKLHEQGSLKTLERIEQLKQRQKEINSFISMEEYERIQRVIREVVFVLCDALADHILERHSKLIRRYQDLDSKTDLTKPHEWYPLARLDKRKIIYHGGPTNSGKTYAALQRLKTAKRGLYVGPLRLLAAEIYESLNAQGVYTSLITGQERREFPFSTHVAATVEMAANLLEEEWDVIVIDEIQMIRDKERGFAWTRALLGLRCKEIHVCGGLEAKNLIKEIAQACNDDFELNTYERFGKLEVATNSLASRPDQLGSYKWVQAGDCVVAFSRNDIFSIKREIERTTNFKCCIIYGTLPPGTRTTQAQLFNDPNSGFDVLIASDAISMGLNLNIRRIIFNSIFKNDGNDIIRLDHSAIKQIAGRAGRRNSPFPEGHVTCRDPRDLEYITECLGTDIQPVEKAGLIFTASHIEKFSEAVQAHYADHDDINEKNDSERKSPHLHWLLQEFNDMAVVKGNFFLCKVNDMDIIARWLKNIPLEISDKYNLTMAPISTQNPKAKDVLVKYGEKIAAGEVPGITRSTPLKRAKTFHDLATLCLIYSEVELFIWLQNKFPPINLMEQQAALAKREMAFNYITLALEEAERLQLKHCHIDRDKKLRKVWTEKHGIITDDGFDAEDSHGESVEDEVDDAVSHKYIM